MEQASVPCVIVPCVATLGRLNKNQL